jgi:hypothetical protein
MLTREKLEKAKLVFHDQGIGAKHDDGLSADDGDPGATEWPDSADGEPVIDPPSNGAAKINTAPEAPPAQRQPLQWLDMSSWDSAPVPQRKWAIKDRVPLHQAGLFSGEGGTGKSIIELMKNVAHVTGKDWLGSMPEPGPAFYLGAEDDKDEIHIQCEGYGRTPGVGDYPMAAVRNREPQLCDGVDFNVFNP